MNVEKLTNLPAQWRTEASKARKKSAKFLRDEMDDDIIFDHYPQTLESCADELEEILKENQPVSQGCKVPPQGYICTREPNHEGPCAAIKS